MRTAEEIAGKIASDVRAQPHAYEPALRNIRKWHSQALAPEPANEVLAAAKLLAADLHQEWKWMAYELVRYHPGAYDSVAANDIADFALDLQSWYAVDGFGTVLVGPIWAKGCIDDAMIEAWSKSQNRWLRRLALVATVGLNSSRSGSSDADRTLPICRQLAADTDDMVAKALAWSLRTLAKRDRASVAAFVQQMDSVLTGGVRREIHNQLKFGTRRG